MFLFDYKEGILKSSSYVTILSHFRICLLQQIILSVILPSGFSPDYVEYNI